MNPSLSTPRSRALSLTLAATLLAATLLAPLWAWAMERVVGSGRTATESRNTGDFQSIALRGSIDAVVRQGPATGVTVTADDNLLPLLETVVEQGSSGAQLVVRWKSGVNLSTRSKSQVQVVTPRLTAVASSGSGDVRIESFSTPELRLALSGSGDAALAALKTEDFRITIAGSGDVKADGSAARLKISIAGSGDVSAGELRAEDVNVSIAGSGDVAVHAQKKLSVSIAGSGDVSYTGDPELTRSVAGSGRVKRR